MSGDSMSRFVLGATKIVGISLLFSSCGILYPNRMMDTKKSFEGSSFLQNGYTEFVIAPGDQLEVLIFPNGGYNLIESQITREDIGFQQQTNVNSLEYTVNADGTANLPRIGLIELGGLTESQAEQKLTSVYSEIYADAFVNVQINGKFVTVFRGSSNAKQIPLTRADITVLEAIGASGGIPESGRSSHIKVVRTVNDSVQIQQIDLSDTEQLALGDAFVLPNDIIYIEPSLNSNVFQEIGPIISTVSGIAVIYAFFVNLNK